MVEHEVMKAKNDHIQLQTTETFDDNNRPTTGPPRWDFEFVGATPQLIKVFLNLKCRPFYLVIFQKNLGPQTMAPHLTKSLAWLPHSYTCTMRSILNQHLAYKSGPVLSAVS